MPLGHLQGGGQAEGMEMGEKPEARLVEVPPRPAPYTLQPTPYTLHPTPYTLHPTTHTLYPAPCTLSSSSTSSPSRSHPYLTLSTCYLNPILPASQPYLNRPKVTRSSVNELVYSFTLNPKPYTMNPAPHTLHPTPYTLHSTPYTLHPTSYTLYTLHPKT